MLIRKLVLFILMIGCLTSISYAQIVDPSRIVTWQGQVGVTGDIPTTRTRCITAPCVIAYNTPTANNIEDALVSAIGGNNFVLLPPGTYDLDNPIFAQSGVTLRGSGMGVTILRGTAATLGYNAIYTVATPNIYLDNVTSCNLGGTPTKGSNSITLVTSTCASAPPTGGAWAVGDYIHIDMTEDPDHPGVNPVIGAYGSEFYGVFPAYAGEGGTLSASCRNPNTEVFASTSAASTCHIVGQTVRITANPSPGVYTIDTPLYWSYNRNVQATKVTNYYTGVGLEDITLDNTLSVNDKIVDMSTMMESWLLRVEMIGEDHQAAFLYGTTKSTIRSCKIHGGYAGGPGAGYTILLWNRATANLIEDNIFFDTGIGVMFNGGVTGNVVAYNYLTGFYFGDPSYNNVVGVGIGQHSAHPMMNLVEGNQVEGASLRFDFTHGTSSHTTILRNYLINSIDARYPKARNLIDLWSYNGFTNIIGNVLGTLGVETAPVEQYDGPFVNPFVERILSYGEAFLESDRGHDVPFNDTQRTSYGSRWVTGNWDSVTNSVTWASPFHTIPNSLYLAGKPSWYGTCQWPPFGSDLTVMTTDLPAKLRYNGQTCSVVAPSSIASFCIGLNLCLNFMNRGSTNPYVTVIGLGTSWTGASIPLISGTGVTILSYTVVSPTLIIMSVSITPTATLGQRDFTMTTGAEVETALNAFTINDILSGGMKLRIDH